MQTTGKRYLFFASNAAEAEQWVQEIYKCRQKLALASGTNSTDGKEDTLTHAPNLLTDRGHTRVSVQSQGEHKGLRRV